MLDEKALEEYIFENIPISLALGIKVNKVSLQEVILSAPIANNINHKKTVFGGSLQAVATLACWSLIYANLKELKNSYEIVISQSEINYRLPVTNDFTVQCLRPDSIAFEKFIKTLQRHGKARLSLTARITQENKLAVIYEGVFVALSSHHAL